MKSPRGSAGGVAALLLLACALSACRSTPVRDAVDDGSQQLAVRLGEPGQLAVVGGMHRMGALPGSGHDPVAALVEEELAVALLGRLRIVDHHSLESALAVLAVEESELTASSDQGADNIRRLGRFLKADLFVTGHYQPRADGEVEVDIKVLDIETLELVATARGDSVSTAEHALDQTVHAGAVVTVPLPVVWDWFEEVSETCFAKDPDGGGKGVFEVIGGWLAVPFYLPVAPFLADYDTTRGWLGIDEPSRTVDPLTGWPARPGDTRQVAALLPSSPDA